MTDSWADQMAKRAEKACRERRRDHWEKHGPIMLAALQGVNDAMSTLGGRNMGRLREIIIEAEKIDDDA